MSNIVSTGSFGKRLWPGVKIWTQTTLRDIPKEYEKLFETIKSDRRYEEIVNMVPMALNSVAVKQEGDALRYSSFKQGVVTRVDNVVYASGFIITDEVEKDDQYAEKLSRIGGKYLARVMLANKETVCANVFNNGFSTSPPSPDSAAFFSATHNYGGVTFSNLSTAAALSEASVEQMMIDIGNQIDDGGVKLQVTPTEIHVPIALQFTAERILGQPAIKDQRPATADRDIHALKSMGYTFAPVVHRYFTSNTAYFVKTDLENGTILFEREAMTGGEQNDFDTDNKKIKVKERFVPAIGDPRAWQGNAGA